MDAFIVKNALLIIMNKNDWGYILSRNLNYFMNTITFYKEYERSLLSYLTPERKKKVI